MRVNPALQPCQCLHSATLILLSEHVSNDMQHQGETVMIIMAWCRWKLTGERSFHGVLQLSLMQIEGSLS